MQIIKMKSDKNANNKINKIRIKCFQYKKKDLIDINIENNIKMTKLLLLIMNIKD